MVVEDSEVVDEEVIIQTLYNHPFVQETDILKHVFTCITMCVSLSVCLTDSLIHHHCHIYVPKFYTLYAQLYVTIDTSTSNTYNMQMVQGVQSRAGTKDNIQSFVSKNEQIFEWFACVFINVALTLIAVFSLGVSYLVVPPTLLNKK